MGFQKIIPYKNPRDGAGGLLAPQGLRVAQYTRTLHDVSNVRHQCQQI